MATQPAPLEFTVVPGGQTEIENTIDAPGKLTDAIEEFKQKIADLEMGLARSLRENLRTGPLKVESAIEELKKTRSAQEAFNTSINACEELRKIIEILIGELKQTQPEALRTVVQARVDQLEKQVLYEKEKEDLLNELINALKRLLADLKGDTAKSKS
jgi:LPS O-antigen subunit length determinant protein (WzzB/FepE family)